MSPRLLYVKLVTLFDSPVTATVTDCVFRNPVDSYAIVLSSVDDGRTVSGRPRESQVNFVTCAVSLRTLSG